MEPQEGRPPSPCLCSSEDEAGPVKPSQEKALVRAPPLQMEQGDAEADRRH